MKQHQLWSPTRVIREDGEASEHEIGDTINLSLELGSYGTPMDERFLTIRSARIANEAIFAVMKPLKPLNLRPNDLFKPSKNNHI